MPNYTIQYISSLKIEDIRNMSTSELQHILPYARGYSMQRERRYNEAVANYQRREKEGGENYFEYGYDSYATPLSERAVDLDLNYSEASRQRLIHELSQYSKYLKLRANTVGGLEKIQRDIKDRIADATGYSLNRKEFKKFWKIYKEVYKNLAMSTKSTKYELWRDIYETMSINKNMTWDEIAMLLENAYNRTTPTPEEIEELRKDPFTIESEVEKEIEQLENITKRS